MTPHINAKKEEIAKVVIMPGDPMRAKFIADTYLEDSKLVNNVRGMYAYTGLFHGKKITVMASGMGMPSIGIYSYELFHFYDVDYIIRIGTAGSYQTALNVYDVLLVEESYSDSSYSQVQNGSTQDIISASQTLNQKIIEVAKQMNQPLVTGRVYSTDVFYKNQNDRLQMAEKHHCLACEMESFALFHNANITNKQAACLLTISNHFITGEETTPQEREKNLTKMIELALEVGAQL